jgi:hypothetical protein
MQHMKENNISYLAITEPMIKPGRSPVGLPKTSIAAPGRKGRRGLMWISGLDHSRDIRAWSPTEEEEDDNLWALINDGKATWYVGAT